MHRGAWKGKRSPGFPADRGVNRQCHAHVHGVADGIADDRVRAMDAPAEAVSLRRGKHFIFLRVVEILDVEPRLILAKRRRGQLALAIGLERSEVMFQPGHQCDMLDRAGVRNRIQDVAHHRRIDPDILSLGFLPQPAADEDGAGSQSLQGGAKRCRVQQIGRHGHNAIDLRRWPPGQSVNLPSLFAEAPREIVADDATGANHECRTCHIPISPRV